MNKEQAGAKGGGGLGDSLGENIVVLNNIDRSLFVKPGIRPLGINKLPMTGSGENQGC